MERERIFYRTDLLYEDGVIQAIGKGLPLDGPNCQAIDCTGKYLIPGLFDAHIHIGASNMLPMLLANGVTSVRHLTGGERVLALAEDIRQGRRLGPSIHASGFVYDGHDGPSENPEHQYISNGEEAEKAVYDTIEAGCLWVKTYPSIRRDLYKRLMDTANACGIPVCGHMSYLVDAKELRDWGYQCCEHSSSLPRHPWDLRYLAESGMWLCQTQVVCETLPDYVWNGKQLEDLPEWAYVPAYLKDLWKRQNEEIALGYKKRGLKPDIQEVIGRGRAFMEYSDRYMAGTDASFPGITAGFSLHNELERLVTLYGASPYEAFKAATIRPASYIGVEKSKGILAVGADADIVILKENPLAYIGNTRSIDAVIRGGQFLGRAELDSMLENAAQLTKEQVEFFEGNSEG